MESFKLKQKGAVWWVTHDHHMPNLSKSSLGKFFYELLNIGANIGEVFCPHPGSQRSWVQISVFMTEEMKNTIENITNFKFLPPPKIKLN